MLEQTHALTLSQQELQVIETALQTQEKILSMQSRAGGSTARERLRELRRVLSRLKRQTPAANAPASDGWTRIARSLCL